jgi:uroporphyrin-III C-methyltransferase
MKEQSNRGKVFIVGAGPGDPELLTLKAVKILEKADIVFFDRLVNKQILNYVNKNAKLVFVGKRDGKHLIPQDEINQMLLDAVKIYKNVVRLKGGDPFLFGRGGEEAIFLSQNNVDFEIIPGITSAIAVPELAGIPITHRAYSSSIVILTGHSKNGKLPDFDWEAIAKIDTIIILMGVSRRAEIAQKLIESGKKPDTPIIFIENGSTENQREIISTLKEVANGNVEINPPAIFLIGDVVKLREKILNL